MSEIYPIGTYYELMPIPMEAEHCVTREAGPVQFVVESRQLSDDLINAASEDIAAFMANKGTSEVADFGGSVHVVGAEDGLEHLRFDCFEDEPHYHYIRHADGGMVICRIDDQAEGDPMQWTLRRLRERLPEMLEFAHVPELAAQVRASYDEIRPVVDDVAELLGQAHERAQRVASG